MPAKSKSQQRLFGAVEGGATFPLAKKIRSEMTRKQIRDFATTKRTHLPDRIKTQRQISPQRAARTFLKAPKQSMGQLYGSRRRGKKG
jgi:hypothetical protein